MEAKAAAEVDSVLEEAALCLQVRGPSRLQIARGQEIRSARTFWDLDRWLPGYRADTKVCV